MTLPYPAIVAALRQAQELAEAVIAAETTASVEVMSLLANVGWAPSSGLAVSGGESELQRQARALLKALGAATGRPK